MSNTEAHINLGLLIHKVGWNSAVETQVTTEVLASLGGCVRSSGFYRAKNQAQRYAQALDAPFIFPSNGSATAFGIVKNRVTLEALFRIILHRAFDGCLAANWHKFHVAKLLSGDRKSAEVAHNFTP